MGDKWSALKRKYQGKERGVGLDVTPALIIALTPGQEEAVLVYRRCLETLRGIHQAYQAPGQRVGRYTMAVRIRDAAR